MNKLIAFLLHVVFTIFCAVMYLVLIKIVVVLVQFVIWPMLKMAWAAVVGFFSKK